MNHPLTLLMAAAVAASSFATAAPIPSLERRGQAVQLIVDGQPYLALAGETANTASSSLEYMDTVWPKLVEMNLNTVLVAIAWDWVEPVEGKYDFTLVDGLLAGARQHNFRLVFLWFGSRKNGISSFVPAWVKADQARFPRTQIKGGKSVEILSTMSDANLQADTRAYVAFMRHLREVDAAQRTVVMIQMQNEVGLLGDSRDRSAAANAFFAIGQHAALGYAIVISVGPDEYFVAGDDVQVTFTPNTPGPEIAGLARAEAGRSVEGRWIPGRLLSGDDVLLDYDLAGAAARNQSGSGLRFGGDGPTVQHVLLYRYR